MSQPFAPATSVRRMVPADRGLVEAFLDTDPGYALFLRSNLAHLSRGPGLARYWGASVGSGLSAVAMDVSGRAALYAPPGAPLQPLADVIAPSLRFTMGRPDLVDALTDAAAPAASVHREEHFFAELDPHRDGASRVIAPSGALIRRATLLDVPALTALYDGSAGFEHTDIDTVRRTIAGRVRSLRTYLAESRGRVVAAASSTAETPLAAMVGGVWTAPEARNQGYAGAVVAAISRDLAEAGMRPYLFYLIPNVTAARLYARVGYLVIGRWSVAYITPAAPMESQATGGEAHV